jgi:hypothetical protein
MNIAEAREQCAKHALSTRKEHTGTKWKNCTLPPSSPQDFPRSLFYGRRIPSLGNSYGYVRNVKKGSA